jgi:hypothetical protein
MNFLSEWMPVLKEDRVNRDFPGTAYVIAVYEFQFHYRYSVIAAVLFFTWITLLNGAPAVVREPNVQGVYKLPELT